MMRNTRRSISRCCTSDSESCPQRRHRQRRQLKQSWIPLILFVVAATISDAFLTTVPVSVTQQHQQQQYLSTATTTTIPHHHNLILDTAARSQRRSRPFIQWTAPPKTKPTDDEEEDSDDGSLKSRWFRRFMYGSQEEDSELKARWFRRYMYGSRSDDIENNTNDGSSSSAVATTSPASSSSYSKEKEDTKNVNRWIQWIMGGGKPRGTNKVIMREPSELGGVPRSDRYSSRDWFHNTITMPNSGILREIRSPVLAITSWATFLSLLHRKILAVHGPTAAAHMYIPSAPHSLMMSALGLLLVFRTNSAYQRFAEGRQIWERIVNASRDLYRMMMLYEKEIGIDKRRRLQRLLAAFPYLLRHRIRPNLVMYRLDDEEHIRDPLNSILLYQDASPTDLDYEAAKVAQTEEVTGQSRRKTRPLFWVDKRTLPWRLLPHDALENCARAQNRPLWVCDRMAREVRAVPDGPHFSARERLAIISHVHKLSHSIGAAERIHQTVVPLNYARHTLRALTVWLFSLPFALVKELNLLTGPVLFIVAWLLFGVYEIGVRIEDPFQGTLRLSIMCDTIRRDVLADENIRSTAFTLEEMTEEDQQAELEGEGDEEESGDENCTVADATKTTTTTTSGSSLFGTAAARPTTSNIYSIVNGGTAAAAETSQTWRPTTNAQWAAAAMNSSYFDGTNNEKKKPLKAAATTTTSSSSDWSEQQSEIVTIGP